MPELNLGGGFGIAYTAVDEPVPSAEIAASPGGHRRGRVRNASASRSRAIAVEPGRSIIGPSTHDPVRGRHRQGRRSLPRRWRATRKYVSVDGGMSDNVRPALYAADYSVRIAGRRSDAGRALVRVAGKHCESGDIVVHDDYLPGDVAPGDLLAVPATGAYCWSLASNYNYLGRPAGRRRARRPGARDRARRNRAGSAGPGCRNRAARPLQRPARPTKMENDDRVPQPPRRPAGRRIGRIPGGVAAARSTATNSRSRRRAGSNSSASPCGTSRRQARTATSRGSCSRRTRSP